MDNQVVNKFCVNCGATLENGAAFCASCGTKVEQPAAPAAPVAPVTPVVPVVPVAPVYNTYAPQAPSTKSKVLGGIGFGLSVLGMLLAFVLFINMIEVLEILDDLSFFGYYLIDDVVVPCFVITLCYMPASILGIVFSSGARNDGNTSGLTMAGKILGIISTVLFGIIAFFCIIALGIAG